MSYFVLWLSHKYRCLCKILSPNKAGNVSFFACHVSRHYRDSIHSCWKPHGWLYSNGRMFRHCVQEHTDKVCTMISNFSSREVYLSFHSWCHLKYDTTILVAPFNCLWLFEIWYHSRSLRLISQSRSVGKGALWKLPLSRLRLSVPIAWLQSSCIFRSNFFP